MEPYLTERFGNASEPHAYGRQAREGLERARATVAELLGCAPAQLVFTSGGSEADNQAVFGLTGRPLGRLVGERDRASGRASSRPASSSGRASRWPGWASMATGVVDRGRVRGGGAAG